MAVSKSLFILFIAVVYAKSTLAYQCPPDTKCQTIGDCLTTFDDPQQSVWGPCEGCDGNTGMCLAKATDVCLSAGKTVCNQGEEQIPQCSSGKLNKNGKGYTVLHICGAFPCCGVGWTPVPVPP